MSKYLYSAVVQGIQSFIFETGKLKEIVGASEIVEDICKGRFEKAIKGMKGQMLLNAAGKVQYVFDKEEDCKKIVKRFIKDLVQEVPGLTVSQAVLKIEGKVELRHIQKLEEQLEIQRTKAHVSHDLGLMIMERSRRTGGAAMRKVKEEGEVVYRDKKQKTKLKYANKAQRVGEEAQDLDETLFEKMAGKNHGFPSNALALDIPYLLKNHQDGWIAVVHADGNNLGKLIRSVVKKFENQDSEHLFTFMERFSKGLDESTKTAAKYAFKKVIEPVYRTEEKMKGQAYIPIRPILLGGDDITFIIRGNLAIDYTNIFLKEFEQQTEKRFKKLQERFNIELPLEGLTACAGIAYVKPKYPFHYSVALAESLCKHAKNISKRLNKAAPSCLSFHRVESSFVGEYYEIVSRELKINDIGLDFGPYFIKPSDGYATIKELKKWVAEIEKEDAPKSGLRTWLTELKINEATAEQLINRIRTLNGKYIHKLRLDAPFEMRKIGSEEDEKETRFTPFYDILTVASI